MPLWFSENGLKRKEVNELFSVIEDDLILDRRGNIYKRLKYLKKSLNRDGNITLEGEVKTGYYDKHLFIKSYLNFSYIMALLSGGEFSKISLED